ncbi:hypothetical protein ACTXT7_013665 [Hymenolepis weldensis]
MLDLVQPPNKYLKNTLLRTMVNSQLILDFLEQLQIPVKRHGKKPDDIAHYCQDCEIEVFNILFVTTQEKRSEVRCFSCARRNDPSLQSFSVLSEYYTSELATIYDNFQTNTIGPATDKRYKIDDRSKLITTQVAVSRIEFFIWPNTGSLNTTNAIQSPRFIIGLIFTRNVICIPLIFY